MKRDSGLVDDLADFIFHETDLDWIDAVDAAKAALTWLEPNQSPGGKQCQR